MGLLYSYVYTKHETNELIINCFICNNILKDIHRVECKTCKNISHITCQIKQKTKNKCVKCSKQLTITCRK